MVEAAGSYGNVLWRAQSPVSQDALCLWLEQLKVYRLSWHRRNVGVGGWERAFARNRQAVAQSRNEVEGNLLMASDQYIALIDEQQTRAIGASCDSYWWDRRDIADCSVPPVGVARSDWCNMFL